MRLLAALPGVQQIRHLSKRARVRYCRGVYQSFQDARAAVPARRAVGYDNTESGTLYLDRLLTVRPTDYAAFHWLEPLLARGEHAVFDFGGNVGWQYYAFRRYLTYPPEMQWLVCDVPAVVEVGRKLAAERGDPHLLFTTEPSQADGFDVFFTSGTLQYLEQDLAGLLAPLAKKPRHLLINRVPLSPRPTYFTVQDIGTACCPYRIGNEVEFIESLRQLGYALIDSWHCHESTCRILFHPSRRVKFYTGMYLRLED